MQSIKYATSRAVLVTGLLLGSSPALAQSTDATPAPTAPAAPSAAPAPAAATAAPAPSASDPSVPGAAPAPPVVPGAAAVVAAPVTDPAPPSFASDPIGNLAEEANLALKLYGDTGFSARSNVANATYASTFSNAKPNSYSPGVWGSFGAPHLDLFASADVAKLSFLTEVVFEASDNSFGVDAERLQIAYLFANWLRVTAGRKHTSFGYYNDTYHHGNLFELTTQRPYAVQFEDSGGIILAHNVGIAIDGTFDAGKTGSFRYDAEVGNGRNEDTGGVALEFSQKEDKMVNVRLRWLPPVDGLIVGFNGMRDVVPGHQPAMGETGAVRPKTEELIGGAHIVYMEHNVHLDVEGFVIRHNPVDMPSVNIVGGFAEIGYSFGAFTPYVRPEWIRFPSKATTVAGDYGPGSDIIYQYDQTSPYYAAQNFTDLRFGMKWLALPQLALKLEGERLAKDGSHQEIATVKAAFGF